MSKGTKFRESGNPNFVEMESQINEGLDSVINRWSDKERHVDLEEFMPWKRKVMDKVRQRIEKLKVKCRRYPQEGEILKRNEIKDFLKNLHKHFVICVVDKAANNFSVMCRKFYLINQAKELGIDTGTFGNETYLKVDQTEEELCGILKDQIMHEFEIEILEECQFYIGFLNSIRTLSNSGS